MASKRIARGPQVAAAYSGNAAGFGVDSDDNQLKLNVNGTQRIIPTGHVRTLSAAHTITAVENGTTFILSHATEFAVTLPAVASGLRFSFIVGNAPETASYTIVVPGGTDLIHGCAVSSADAGGSVDSTAGTAADTITFVDGQAAIGDRVDVISDGTFWYAFGVCGDEDAITFTAGA
jgi:hypothetical protein